MLSILHEEAAAKRAACELIELVSDVVAEVEAIVAPGWDELLFDANGRRIAFEDEAWRWLCGETSHKGYLSVERPLERRYPAPVRAWRARDWSRTHLLRRELRKRLMRYASDQGGIGGRPRREPMPGAGSVAMAPLLASVCQHVAATSGERVEWRELWGEAWIWLCAQPDADRWDEALLRKSLKYHLVDLLSRSKQQYLSLDAITELDELRLGRIDKPCASESFDDVLAQLSGRSADE